MHRPALAALSVALLLGCGEDAGPERLPAEAPRDAERPAAGPPDAGTRFGHGADDRPRRGGRIVVPDTDPTPPTATIRAAGAVAVSPSSARDRPKPISLSSDRFRATAIAVDTDGGTGRVRLSLSYVVRCGATVRRVTEHRPPAQIARVRLAPGADAPTRRVRTAMLRLRVGRGCTAEGEVFAEASNAHGRDAVSRHLRFVYTRPG